MLFRKIESIIEEHLKSLSNKILLIDGAQQIGLISRFQKCIYNNFYINIFYSQTKYE